MFKFKFKFFQVSEVSVWKSRFLFRYLYPKGRKNSFGYGIRC